MRATLDNWQLSGIASFIRGAPMGISIKPKIDLMGGSDSACILLTGNPVFSWGDHTLNQHFNTSVVQQPPVNTIGQQWPVFQLCWQRGQSRISRTWHQ
jgi:hypothetical protein